MNNRLFLCTILLLSGASLQSSLAFAQGQLNPLLKKPSSTEWITIKKAITTDTLLLDNNKKIKLIGLKAPLLPPRETLERDSYGIIIEETESETSLEERALSFVKNLVEGQQVRFEYDAETSGENHYALVYVFLKDNTFVNAEILRQGFANLKIAPPNVKYEKTLKDAYQEARREKRGLQGE